MRRHEMGPYYRDLVLATALLHDSTQDGSPPLPRPKSTFLRQYIDHCPPYRRNRRR